MPVVQVLQLIAMVKLVALAVQVIIVADVQLVIIVQLVMVAINALVAKLVIHNVIQITNNYLAPSHVYPLPAWQLPLLLNNPHDQLYTSLHS